MAETVQEIGVLTAKDDNGTVHELYPVTKTEAVNGLDEALAAKINTSDIVDNLESTSTVLPLSANQGNVISKSINELKKSVSDGKSSLASAITAKGVTTAADATFETMASNISSLTFTANPSAPVQLGNNSTYILFAGNKSLSASFNTGNFTIIVVVCWTKGGSGYITGEASISNIVKKIIKNNDSACDLSICQVNKNKSCTASFTKYQPTNDYTTMAIKVYGVA